jgi:hypothetical protein
VSESVFHSRVLPPLRVAIRFLPPLCRLAYKYRWNQAISSDGNTGDFLLYPIKSVVNMPPSNEDIDNKLNRIRVKVEDLIRTATRRVIPHNLSRDDHSILKQLKRKPLIFLPSDKGGEFCVIDELRYKELGFQHLNNPSTYQPIPHITTKTIENKVNNTWRMICGVRNLSIQIRKSYITNNSNLPRFYHLIKTHKSLTDLKIRPIVSSCAGPTEKICWLLSS